MRYVLVTGGSVYRRELTFDKLGKLHWIRKKKIKASSNATKGNHGKTLGLFPKTQHHQPRAGAQGKWLIHFNITQPRVLLADTRASWFHILRMYSTTYFKNENEQSCVNHRTPETGVFRRKTSLNSLKFLINREIWQHPSDNVYFFSQKLYYAEH